MNKNKKFKKLKNYSLPIFLLTIVNSLSAFAHLEEVEDKEFKGHKTHHVKSHKLIQGELGDSPPKLKGIAKEKPTEKEIMAHIDVIKELKAKAKEEMMDLDAFANEVFKSQSGQHLKAYFPNKSVSEALEGMIHKELKTIQGKILGQKQKDPGFTEGDPILNMINSNYDRVFLESLAYAKRAIANEIKYGQDYYALYHAHMPDLGLYYDMLKQIKQAHKMQSFGGTNVFREMGSESASIEDLLANYEKSLEELSKANNKPLNSAGPGSTMGFSEAPDHMIWAKNHMISANLSLFGNLGKLGENTFYYFLNSLSHISNVDFLMQRLLKTIMPDSSDAEVANRLSKYKNLFENHMRKGGGHLLQIFVKKDKINEMAFASHPFGVPIWMDKKTKHFAMSKNKRTPLAKINADKKDYQLPKVSSYIELYKRNPMKFSDTYSPVHKKGSSEREFSYNDAAQVRLVMDPQKLLDNTIVIESTRVKIFKGDVKAYHNELNRLVLEDMSKYIAHLQGKKETMDSKASPLQKFLQLIKKGFSGKSK